MVVADTVEVGAGHMSKLLPLRMSVLQEWLAKAAVEPENWVSADSRWLRDEALEKAFERICPEKPFPDSINVCRRGT